MRNIKVTKNPSEQVPEAASRKYTFPAGHSTQNAVSLHSAVYWQQIATRTSAVTSSTRDIDEPVRAPPKPSTTTNWRVSLLTSLLSLQLTCRLWCEFLPMSSCTDDTMSMSSPFVMQPSALVSYILKANFSLSWFDPFSNWDKLIKRSCEEEREGAGVRGLGRTDANEKKSK